VDTDLLSVALAFGIIVDPPDPIASRVLEYTSHLLRISLLLSWWLF
jgi:hypothetical protein